MIKVFIPQDKTQGKTNIRGLWLNDKGILFYDYLKVDVINTFFNRQRHKLMIKKLDKIRLKYNQEALFFADTDIIDGYNVGYILNNDLSITELLKVKRFTIGKDRANLKGLIKRLLRDYKGLTIYTEPEGYVLEVYYNEGII